MVKDAGVESGIGKRTVVLSGAGIERACKVDQSMGDRVRQQTASHFPGVDQRVLGRWEAGAARRTLEDGVVERFDVVTDQDRIAEEIEKLGKRVGHGWRAPELAPAQAVGVDGSGGDRFGSAWANQAGETVAFVLAGSHRLGSDVEDLCEARVTAARFKVKKDEAIPIGSFVTNQHHLADSPRECPERVGEVSGTVSDQTEAVGIDRLLGPQDDLERAGRRRRITEHEDRVAEVAAK